MEGAQAACIYTSIWLSHYNLANATNLRLWADMTVII